MPAASKLLNLRNPALHNLIRRHLLHPAAVASPTLRGLENVSNGSPDNSRIAENSNLHASDFALNLRLPFGLPVMQIQAARSNVPSAGSEGDDDLEDDDDDGDGFDDEADEGDYSGSDYDDDEDEEEEADARPPSRSYRK